MGLAEQRAKSAAFAAYMKTAGIQRRTASCPNGCGQEYPLGFPAYTGAGLIAHLNVCKGTHRKAGKR